MDELYSPQEMPPPVFRAIVVKDAGSQKIQFIKLIREFAQLGLAEAKEIADRPTPFVLAVCEESIALAFQASAAKLGATCELADYDGETAPAIADGATFGPAGAGRPGCLCGALMVLTAAVGVAWGLIFLIGRPA